MDKVDFDFNLEDGDIEEEEPSNVISLAAWCRKSEQPIRPKSNTPRIKAEDLKVVEQRNAANRQRVKEEREGNNKSVVRSYRLGKNKE